MKIYITLYYNHFGLSPQADIVWDEYEWIVNNVLVEAKNIHHIEHGANKHDHINNLMALSYDNHNKAHAEQLGHRDSLKEIHLQFLNNNPYD